jgi:hypothetical protein
MFRAKIAATPTQLPPGVILALSTRDQEIIDCTACEIYL